MNITVVHKGGDFVLEQVQLHDTVEKIKKRIEDDEKLGNGVEWDNIELYSLWFHLSNDLTMKDCLPENKSLGLYYRDDQETLAEVNVKNPELQASDSSNFSSTVFVTHGHKDDFKGMVPVLAGDEVSLPNVGSKKISVVVTGRDDEPKHAYRYELPTGLKRGEVINLTVEERNEETPPWMLYHVVMNGPNADSKELKWVDMVPYKTRDNVEGGTNDTVNQGLSGLGSGLSSLGKGFIEGAGKACGNIAMEAFVEAVFSQ